MRHYFAICLLIIITLATFQPAFAQTTVNVTEANVTHEFGAFVNFKAKLNAPAQLTDVLLLFRAQGESAVRSERIPFSPDGQIDYQYTFTQGPIRPFASVDYWFHVTLQSGEQVESEHNSFTYDDNRFQWQTSGDDSLKIHWYAGDADFAQSALNAARRGLQRSVEMLATMPNRPLEVYIYTVAADLQTALEMGGIASVAGHASPDLGIALVYIAPGTDQVLEMERKIPHELAHLLTYELAKENYPRLPIWLREGIASAAEISPSPDYNVALNQAAANHTIIPMTKMCSSLPPESSRVLLAYAESASFTRYLVSQKGTSGLVTLIQAYADGLDCEQGAVRAFSRPLSSIESDWRSTVLHEDTASAALGNLFPYLVVLGIMLVIPLALLFIPGKKA